MKCKRVKKHKTNWFSFCLLTNSIEFLESLLTVLLGEKHVDAASSILNALITLLTMNNIERWITFIKLLVIFPAPCQSNEVKWECCIWRKLINSQVQLGLKVIIQWHFIQSLCFSSTSKDPFCRERRQQQVTIYICIKKRKQLFVPKKRKKKKSYSYGWKLNWSTNKLTL